MIREALVPLRATAQYRRHPVSTFAIDRTTGRLKHLARATPLVYQMAYINTDR
jgi:hypothetical protein